MTVEKGQLDDLQVVIAHQAGISQQQRLALLRVTLTTRADPSEHQTVLMAMDIAKAEEIVRSLQTAIAGLRQAN